MVLSLVNPVGANFIKDWPATQAVNAESIDAFAGPCMIGSPLNSYTPQLHANGSDPNLGVGGFTRGHYYRIWDQIYSWGEFRFGSSGTSVGSGTYIITLPFPADTTFVGAAPTPGGTSIVGNGLQWDNSADTAKRPLVVQLRSATEIEFLNPISEAVELVASGAAITWTNGDGISWFVQYKRSSA